MYEPLDYHLHHAHRRHQEDLEHAARRRQLPPRARPPSRWRPLLAALLHRLADRVAAEQATPVRRRA